MSQSSQNLEIQQNYNEEEKILISEAEETIENCEQKLKEFEKEERCQSVQNLMKDYKEKYLDSSRARSESVIPFPQPIKLKLPLKKFYKMYSKVMTQLETVRTLSESKRNETENLADLRRQIQRADEFSIRFSRNNLYETKRVIHEVKRIIVPYPFEKLSQSECRELSKKLMLSYQLASQSLQTYINHVKNPVNLELPEKLSELTLLITDLFLCCEHLALPPGDFYTQNDAVQLCNELVAELNAKAATCNFSDIKEMLTKKKSKPLIDDVSNVKNLSMYKKKFTCLGLKTKSDIPKKKFGVFLANRMKRLKKKDEKKARITHEIYTQKMNPPQVKRPGNTAIKFETPKEPSSEKDEAAIKKPLVKKSKFLTPKEVRSQDDDVETMVQAIGNDENVATKIGLTTAETDDESVASNNSNKVSFRELLLELIDELQHTDKKEQKATLKRLLSSIQNCAKNDVNSLKTPRMKVYHFKSRDMEELPETDTEKGDKVKFDLTTLYEGQKVMEEILARERRLNPIFRPIKQRKVEKTEEQPIPRGKIELKLSKQMMKNVFKYKKAFYEYKKKDIMYTKTQAKKPWDLVAEISDHIILDVIKEISLDLQNDVIWRRLFYNELLEVVN